MNRFERFERFGAKLGVLLCLAGFVLIFLGWNGAASVDSVTAQFPYLISVDIRRDDGRRVEEMLAEVRDALARLAPPVEEEVVDTGTGPRVVTGQTSFHRPDCRLLEGREGLAEMSLEAATARGLLPCRICEPARAARAPGRPARTGRRPRARRGRVGPR